MICRLRDLLLGRLKSDQKECAHPFSDVRLDSVAITSPPVFVLGTGRCGTHFLEALMRRDHAVRAIHTDSVNAIADSFLRYQLWYDLPVDLEAARLFRHRMIISAQKDGKKYFESNAYLSLAATKLHAWYGAHLILLIRDPVDVVNSHVVKGWYESDIALQNPSLAPGFPPDMRANQFFGRIMPRGKEYSSWLALTRIGKISWWINALNMEVYRQLQTLPREHWQIVKIEDINHQVYLRLHQLAGGGNALSEDAFHAICQSRPGKGKRHIGVDSWSEQERSEFFEQTEELRKTFGY